MDFSEDFKLIHDLRLALAGDPSWKDDEDESDDDADENEDDNESDATDDNDGDGDDANEDEDEDDDDVDSLKSKLGKATKDLASKDAHIEKLKKENGKWRTRYRQLQKSGSSNGDTDSGEEDKATAEAEKLKRENRELKLTTAMSDAMSEHKFHDRDLVRGLVLKELEDVDDVDEAMEDIPGVVEALVKERPYLVKADKGDKDEEDPEDDDAPPSGRSSKRKKKGDGTSSDAELAKRFPALARR